MHKQILKEILIIHDCSLILHNKEKHSRNNQAWLMILTLVEVLQEVHEVVLSSYPDWILINIHLVLFISRVWQW